MSTTNVVPPPLSQGWGYGVLLGVGFGFAALMYGITYVLKKYNNEDPNKFEEFIVASRNIGTSLTATAVISSWAWSTALLSSAQVTYNFGIAGAFWFAAGCLVQISFFALLAIQSKKKTPNAHTVLEVVKARYGKIAHVLYMILCLATNLIATINMFLGSSATISALTGLDITASIFLIPLGVLAYTLSGGLRAVVITDLFHTLALLIIALYLSIKTLTNPEVGGISGIYERVQALALTSPVAGNTGGSYLTMSSRDALAFGTLHTLGNFGLVLMDTSYWAKAYSADMTAAAPGYIIGGILYFGIPWGLGTVIGTAALSLGNSPLWPAVGRKLTDAEANNGLALAYTAQAVARNGGAIAVLIVIFFAVTSTSSAQIMGVSAISSSDLYKTYVNPRASEKSIILVGRLAAIAFTFITCGISVAFYKINLSLTWTLYFLGIITCPGMVTLALTVLWKRQTKLAAIVSPIVGLGAGLAVWLTTSKHYGGGVINVTTTGAVVPTMYGNIASAFVPVILSPLISWIRPEPDFAWERFSEIKLIDDEGTEKVHDVITPSQLDYMNRMSKYSGAIGVFLFIVVWVIWPFSMYATYSDLSLTTFRGWIVVSVIWLAVTLAFVAFAPPIEGRHVLARLVRGLLTGKKAEPHQSAPPAYKADPERSPSSGGSLSDQSAQNVYEKKAVTPQ